MIHVALFGIEAGLGAVLTYLIHSTLWIFGALLVTRWHRLLSPSARNVVWRAALIGPVASSVFALGLGRRWEWALTEPSAADVAWASAAPYAATLRPLSLASPVELGRDTAGSVSVIASGVPTVSWSALLVLGWASVALACLLLLTRAVLRQRRALAVRIPVTDAASLGALDRLARCAGLRHAVRLSCSAHVSSPLVLSAREICLPERACELDGAALEAVLAHELAHIERRDGLWLYVALVLQAVLWFQPLNRKARAELSESAELAADDRAVELTGDALGLARTLTQVASWVNSAAAAPAPSLAMARAGSPIVERVARLVHASDVGHDSRLSSRTPWFALAALTAIGACSPSVGAPQAPEPRAPRPSAAPASPAIVPTVASNPAPLPMPTPAAVPTTESSGSWDAAHPAGEPSDGVERRDANEEQAHDIASAEDARRDHSLQRQTRAESQRLGPQQGNGASFDFPIGDLVSEVVGSVVPNAVAFSQNVSELALDEQRLQQRIRVAESRLPGKQAAPAPGRAELERLRRELAEMRARRQRLERDFEARMEAWSKDFEQRFDREFGPRFAAWGEDFGRRMAAMSQDLELQLGSLRALSIPPPPPLPRMPKTSPMPKSPPLAAPPLPTAPPVPNAPPAPQPSGPGAPTPSVPVPSVPSLPAVPSAPPSK